MDKQSFNQISHENPIIIFDGMCILCNRAIQYIIQHDKSKRFRYMTLQRARELHLIVSTLPDSIILFDKGQVHIESKAIINISKYIGSWQRFVGNALQILPSTLTDFFYQMIARNRYQWFGKNDQCMLPPPQWKQLFLG